MPIRYVVSAMGFGVASEARPRFCSGDSMDDVAPRGVDMSDDKAFAVQSRRSGVVTGVWTVALLFTGICMQRSRSKVDGHLPPIMVPQSFSALVSTASFLAVLMVPWSLLVWRQLRFAGRRHLPSTWRLVDFSAAACIFTVTAFGATCLLGARQATPSLSIVVGTTAFGLAFLGTVVLIAVRVGFSIIGLVVSCDERVWEPLVARCAVISLFLLALYDGFSPPVVRTVELSVAGLAEEADGYTMCMLSDLHAGPVAGQRSVRSAAQRTLELGCRVVLLNGDIAEGTVAEREQEMSELLALASVPDGAYFVPGNHEFYNFGAIGGSREAAVAWTNWWDAHGVTSLNNSHVELPLDRRGPGWFTLAGVDDMLGSPNLDKALSAADSDLPTVLASHRPGFVEEAARKGLAVQLSGHTHGGQLWPVHVAAARSSDGYLSGLYEVEGTHLYVSDGTIGTYQTRLRLFSSNEITQVVLRAPGHKAASPAHRSAEAGLLLSWALLSCTGASIAGFGARIAAGQCKAKADPAAERDSLDEEEGLSLTGTTAPLPSILGADAVQ